MKNPYWEMLKKNKVGYLIEAVLALVIYQFIGLEGFLIYAFIILIVKIDVITEYIRKCIRVAMFQVTERQSAIMKKLKISEKDLLEAVKEEEAKTEPEAWKSLERDIRDTS